MRKLLESVPQVVSEDKETGKLKEDFESKTEKFDEGKRGGAEPEITEAYENILFCGRFSIVRMM